MTRLDQLEELLSRENQWHDDDIIVILPNGEIQSTVDALPEMGTRKPLTFRENLGGEYAIA